MTAGVSRKEDLVHRAHVALGGSLGTFVLPDDLAVVVERAEGPYLYDIDGRRYIDYLLGSGPMLLGHARPEIVAAIQQQVSKGLSYFVLNEPVIELAERMIDLVPCAEMVRFVSSGTEATFHALRIARTYMRRPKVLKFEGGYHGVHDYAMMSAMSPVQTHYPTPIPDSGGIPREVEADVIVSRWNDLDLTERLIREHASDLAAVICEPLQRALIPAPGFLKAVREITECHGVLLIFDEVVTGFRLALGGAQEKYGVVPDLAAFGKAMSAGYPMAAIAGRAEIMGVTSLQRAGSADIARVAGTMSGNPVGAVAGIVSLDLLSQPGVYERLYATSDALKNGLRALAAERDVAVQVIGEGPVFQMLFASEPITDYPSFLAADREKSKRFGLECIRRGVTTTPGEKFYVSSVHGDDDVEETLDVFARAFDAVLETS
ncbi:MAG TPA: aminotransferase class III-fold pyridoxal phosphate-dependent enzyme [Thermomicrobiales bacterium]|nr:aminotransferase class III-fold pyridoxal phosphate-dependent enzyme [Thermomicrobiales bacterium]